MRCGPDVCPLIGAKATSTNEAFFLQRTRQPPNTNHTPKKRPIFGHRLPAGGNGGRHEHHRSAGRLCRHPQTRPSEHIMRGTDVLYLSVVTVRGLVLEWLDAMSGGLAVQGVMTRRLFLKVGWLMDKHAVSADCLLAVQTIRWSRRCVKQAQLQGNTREATTLTAALSMDCGALDMLVQFLHAGKTDAVLPAQPWPHIHHVTSENGWATTSKILKLANALGDAMNPGGEGESWILLWNMASIHAIRKHTGRHGGVTASQHFVLAALRLGRIPQLQELRPDANERHCCQLRHRRLIRRHRDEPGMATTAIG